MNSSWYYCTCECKSETLIVIHLVVVLFTHSV
uniref:Uncharacterized protein n=1 Tax=Anguilla anguilla TaxID=7936 RepID=A0A0E9V2E9_ANGAN